MALTIQGELRRRALDLGLVEGTKVRPLFKSPFGNLTAYAVRGAVMALREDMAGGIIVLPYESE